MISISDLLIFGEVGVWEAVKGFFANMIEWFYQLTAAIGLPSYVLAIFIFTLVVRVLLQPLMNKQLRSSRKMQLLKPEVDDIKRRYANNPQRQQQETMKLYKENGASPTAGCLPLLIQLPILWALFTAMRNFGVEGSTHPLYPEAFHFWVWDDLAQIVSQAPLPWLLPIVAAAVTFLQQYLTTPNVKDKQNRIMLIAFPAMFLFFVRSFPILMGFYWIFFSLISCAITLPLLRHWRKIDTAELEAKRQAKEEELQRRKEARKNAKENYYNGKPRKEVDKHGKRGHVSEDVVEAELTPEQLAEREFKDWLIEGGYTVNKKRVKLHPYSVEPEVVLMIKDEKGVEQDEAKLRQEFQAAQRMANAPTPPSMKDLFGRKKKGAAAAAADAADTVTEAADAAVDTVTEAADAAVDTVSEAADTVAEAAADTVADAAEAVENVAEGLMENKTE